jgi:hypothetical protein
VTVNEPGRHDMTLSVDLGPAGPGHLPDFDDAVARHGNVSPVTRRTRAIDNQPTPHDDVVIHGPDLQESS